MGSRTITYYWVDEDGNFVVESAGTLIVVDQYKAATGAATTLNVSTLGLGSYTAIAQIRDIRGPGLSVNAINVTTRDSADEEFVDGLRDGGEVTFDILFDPASTASHGTTGNGLTALMRGSTVVDWRLSLQGTTNWDFSGYVARMEPMAPLDDAFRAMVTIRVTGQPALV